MRHDRAFLPEHAFTDIDAYVTQAEILLGHSLHGRGFGLDGYSVDNCISHCLAGVTVDDYVTCVAANPLYMARIWQATAKPIRGRAFAARCVIGTDAFTFGRSYLAVPFPADPWSGKTRLSMWSQGIHHIVPSAMFEPVHPSNRGHFPHITGPILHRAELARVKSRASRRQAVAA